MRYAICDILFGIICPTVRFVLLPTYKSNLKWKHGCLLYQQNLQPNTIADFASILGSPRSRLVSNFLNDNSYLSHGTGGLPLLKRSAPKRRLCYLRRTCARGQESKRNASISLTNCAITHLRIWWNIADSYSLRKVVCLFSWKIKLFLVELLVVSVVVYVGRRGEEVSDTRQLYSSSSELTKSMTFILIDRWTVNTCLIQRYIIIYMKGCVWLMDDMLRYYHEKHWRRRCFII